MADQSPFRLVPLRVPGGWKVDHNSFFAVDTQVDSEYHQIIAKYLVEDLAYIHNLDQSVDQMIHIELGWYPDMDLSGKYRLNIVRGNDTVLDVFVSESYEDIASRITYWFDEIQKQSGGRDDAHKLMPLRISSGWSVQTNRLMSDVFCQDAGDLESQKILLLVKEYPQGRFIFVSLDQSLNISGQVIYTLAITRDKQDEPIKTYESTDKEEISLIVEQWMEVAHRIGMYGVNTELLAPAQRS